MGVKLVGGMSNGRLGRNTGMGNACHMEFGVLSALLLHFVRAAFGRIRSTAGLKPLVNLVRTTCGSKQRALVLARARHWHWHGTGTGIGIGTAGLTQTQTRPTPDRPRLCFGDIDIDIDLVSLSA